MKLTVRLYMWRLTFAILASFRLFSGTNADSSISASTGNTVSIWCKSPDNTSVFWQHQREITGRNVFLNTGTGIAEPYRSKIGLESLSSGQHLLTIHNLTTNDSGIYICSEEAGFGAKHYTRLLVKERHTHSSESAIVGSTVKLQCMTTVQIRILWTRQSRETNVEEPLTTETYVLPQHTSKFAFAALSSGDYALMIRNVQREDSGLYSCVEAGRNRHTVNLTVSYTARNECLSNPCANGGRCVNCVNKYTCVCPEGFRGANCDKGVQGFETSTKKMDHTGLSGPAVGLVICLVFIFVVVIFFVFLAVRCWKVQQRRYRYSEKSQEKKPLKSKNSMKEDDYNKNDGAAVLEEPLNFVSGIAAVADRIYVLKCATLLVYDAADATLKPKNQLSVPGLKEHVLNDMASASLGEHRTLYISDYEGEHIRQFKLSGTGEVENWHLDPFKVLEKKDKPSGLSVSYLPPENENDENYADRIRLLVSYFESRKLFELDVKGDVKTEIKFPSNLNVHWDMHAVRLPNVEDNFVVCHGGDEVCVISNKSEILYSLKNAGLDEKPSYAQLGWPCHIAVSRDNNIFVADYYNDRVIELKINPDKKELECVGEVKKTKKVYRPRKLFLHEDKLLYIGVATGEVFCVDVMN